MRNDLRYGQVISFVTGQPWAILPSKMSEILAFLHAKTAGERIDPEILAEMRAAAQSRPKQQRASGGVAVLPVFGTISHRMNLMSELSGGTSVEGLQRDFRSLVNDPDISAIVLDVDSPGGSVSGIAELADEIYRARGKKPITAVANTLAASAAYWIASAADEIVVTPSALVGSIGVLASHEDRSGFYEKLGVDISLITAGKYKDENNPFGPLTDEGKAQIQKHVDEAYSLFTRGVARGRKVSVETVRNDYGEGRVFGAREAVANGMADRMATRDEVVATIGRAREEPQDMAAYNHATTLAGGTGLYISDVDGDVIHRYKLNVSDSTTSHNGWIAPTAKTFENEADAALTAVRSVQARVEALTALREDRNTPVSQARVPLLMEHRDAYRAVADAYDALVVACRTDAADLAAHRLARLQLIDLDMLLAEAR